MIKIYNAGNTLEADQLLAALEQNHVAAFGKELGADSYMKITGGMSMSGTDIYVAEEDAEAAKEIIEGIVMISDDSEDESGELRKYQMRRRLYAIISLLVFMAVAIMGMLFVIKLIFMM